MSLGEKRELIADCFAINSVTGIKEATIGSRKSSKTSKMVTFNFDLKSTKAESIFYRFHVTLLKQE